MKKKSKNQVYIPHQDKWNEHFPTPGKPNPNYYTDSGATFNKHLRTPNKLKQNENPTNPSNPIYLVIIKIYHQIPSPTKQTKTKIHILNPINPINPKNTKLLTHQTKTN